jgi:Tfp pilus assembly ATPase PilU
MILGLVGFVGAGKDTAADYLVNLHEFRRESFAATLKDAVAAVFGWDRVMLEGRTKQAREWREQVDVWWAERLHMPELTPRWVLQHWGTEVCRRAFHDDVWIASLENRLRQSRDNIVISDCRFPNEIAAIKRASGRVVRITRGP